MKRENRNLESFYQPCEHVDIRTEKLILEVLGHEGRMTVDEDPDILGADPSAPFYPAVLTSLLPEHPKELDELLADRSYSLET